MELREMRYLLALAEELNFTRAAARCHVSQQTFSRAIALLERRLGITLVHRRARGCALTLHGARLAAATRPLVEEADLLLFRAGIPIRPAQRATPLENPHDRLRVGLMLDGLGTVTMPVLRAYRAANPTVRLVARRLNADRVIDALLDSSIDIALLHGPVHDERIAMVELFTEPRIATVSSASPLADASALATADLITVPARTRRPSVRPGWEGFFTLVAERNGEQPERVGEPTGSLEELLYSIALEELFLTMPAHLATTYPGALFGVRYVPAPELAPVAFGIASLRPVSEAVEAFHAVAAAVVAAHLLGVDATPAVAQSG